MKNEINHITVKSLSVRNSIAELPAEKFSEVLDDFEIEYRLAGYYWQVGETSKVQGWIIHLSVVISQVDELLKKIIPYLLKKKVSFKIPIDRETVTNLLHGLLGISQMGKIICIYPETDEAAYIIAKELVILTEAFKGPAILTDIQLGNIVYTRYGSFNPILVTNQEKKEEKYIYDTEGKLIKDDRPIPFIMLKGVSWPFRDLAQPVPQGIKKILKNVYKPISLLKFDLRGSVYDGLYLKSIFKVIKCVIKEGNLNMVSDEYGRDIYDRLIWQKHLHDELSRDIPVPKIFDLFVEGNKSYLVMEFINGKSLYGTISEFNYSISPLHQLSGIRINALIDLLISIGNIINNLHRKGIVHRDITPGNFLIDKTGKIFLIDIELAYSINLNKPIPPFELGTPGFISPEQQAVQIPTLKEDIYGFGALLVAVFTGLSPVRFFVKDSSILFDQLKNFIDNDDISSIITDSLSFDPEKRPDMPAILGALEKYKSTISFSKDSPNIKYTRSLLDEHQLTNIITQSLKCLSLSPIISLDNIWYSLKKSNEISDQSKKLTYTRYPGLHTGLAGPLYLLARSEKAGFSIDQCAAHFNKSWEFIKDEYFKEFPTIGPGLYKGYAGLVMALIQCLESGIFDDSTDHRSIIQRCLELPSSLLTIEEGISGQGIALLRAIPYMDHATSTSLLEKIINALLQQQRKDGSWDMRGSISIANGTGGIIYFLLEYALLLNDSTVRSAIEKGLSWMLRSKFHSRLSFKDKSENPDQLLNTDRLDYLLITIKAFEYTQEQYLKKMIETILIGFPSRLINNNFSQVNGMAALGEIYLEAWRVLQNEEWKMRADWLANVYVQTFQYSVRAAGYWKMEESNEPTADLMTGISGIIHFLLRSLRPEKIGYRLLT